MDINEVYEAWMCISAPVINLEMWRADYETCLDSHKRFGGHERALTTLHAVRAHYRGKVHGPRRRLDYAEIAKLKLLPTEQTDKICHNGGTAVVELTHSAQAQLYAHAIKAYEGLPRAVEDGAPQPAEKPEDEGQQPARQE